MAKISKGLDLYGLYIGEVVGYNSAERTVDVVIPKLLPLAPSSGKYQRALPTRTNKRTKITGIDYENTVVTTNFITVRAFDRNESMPKIGSKVHVIFLEGDITMPYWREFRILESYDVIDEERYKPLYKLSIGGKQIDINEDDTVVLELPDDQFSVVQRDDTDQPKRKIYRIQNKTNYVISDTQPSKTNSRPGLMWFDLSNNKLKVYNGEMFKEVRWL